MTETNLSLNVQVSNYQPSLSAQQIFDKVVDIVCAYYRADKKRSEEHTSELQSH